MTGNGGSEAATKPATRPKQTGRTGGSGGTTGSGAGPASVPLPAYIDSLRLAGNKERVTAILVWSADAGKEQVTAAEIKALWSKTHLKPAGNLSRDIAAAAKKGWITSEGQGWVAHGFGKKAAAGWVEKGE